jgi:aspartyl-tRNA(Asn)/glutamyl-tRNA(Gln) amidotransferase subunit A
MADQELIQLTVAQLGRRIQRKAVSPVEVAEAFIERIEALEPKLNAFITRTFDEAMEAAQVAEKEIQQGGYKGPFHGVPIGFKDLFWTKDVKTTSGSQIDKDFVPEEDSEVVARFKAAGAYTIGKLNMVEYAFGPTGANAHYGSPRNPWDTERMPGGSSSGSGVAVAAGEAPLAMGTDTGGSVRIPASLCGLTGLKPTFGLVSRFGVTPLSWTLDHPGPLAHSAQDVALAMNILAGHDPRDPGSANRPAVDYTKDFDKGLRDLRIGVPRDYVWDLMDPEVEQSFKAAMAQLESLGARIEEVPFPELAYAEAVSSTIITTEANAYHARNIRTQGDLFDPAVRRRVEGGFFISSGQYMQALRVSAMVGKKMREIMGHVDLIATPTTAAPAPTIGETLTTVNGHPAPTRETLLRLTRIFNLNGPPAISLPSGFSSGGLPIGLQLVGKPFDDALVLRVAHAYQQATDWHVRRPSL